MPGNVKRPGGGDRIHDPRRPMPGAPSRDDRKPAGDERVADNDDDVPDIGDKSRAPIPDVPRLKKPKPVD